MFCLRLGLLLGVAGISHGYLLNRNATSFSLRLTDVETGVSPISTLFLKKETKVSVDGVLWLANEKEEEPSGFLEYALFVDNEAVDNGTIYLADDPLGPPTTIDVGTIVVNDSGATVIQVKLKDKSEASITTKKAVRAHRSWIAFIPVFVAAIMFLILNIDLVPTFFLTMFIGSWVIEGSIVEAFQAMFVKYVLNAVSNRNHLLMFLFIVGIHVLSETINKSGGTNEVLRILSPYSSRACAAQLILFVLGAITFFDPYVSIMVLAKVIGSVLKGFPISVEKVAFLVDTTALPVSSIIPGSSWFIWTTGVIQRSAVDGKDTDSADLLASAMKYQFYPVLILAMALLQLILSRETGPILKRENEKRSEYGKTDEALETALSALRLEATKPEKSWNWWLPVLALNVLLWAGFIQFDTDMVLDATGYSNMLSAWMTSTAATVVIVQCFYFLQSFKTPPFKRLPFWRRKRNGLAFLTDTFPSGSASIPYATSKSDCLEPHIDQDFGDITGSPKAEETPDLGSVEETQPQKYIRCWKDRSILTRTEAIDALSDGITTAIPFLVTQSLSWSVSDVYMHLGVDRIFVAWILDEGISPEALPIIALVAAFLLTVVLGSSWITVSVMIPSISQSFLNFSGTDSGNYDILLGSILSGAVAGDHIGPFSETSILSGLMTGCGVRSHFFTQVPYAVSVLLLSILAGTLPVSYKAYPEFFGFFIGFVVICLFVILCCRRLQKPRFLPGRSGDAITKELHPLQKGMNQHEHLPDGMIMPVNTEDLIDRDEDQTGDHKDTASSADPQQLKDKKQTPTIRTHTLQSFKSKLQEVNSGSGDPILGLVEDGLLPVDIKDTLKCSSNQIGAPDSTIQRDTSHGSNRSTFESKKRLIEATIKNSEKDGNIFSESLRMFLRTAETKLDQIMSEGSLDIRPSQSADSGDDDSLDNLMMDIATKGWKSAVDEATRRDDGDTDVTGIGEGYTTGGGYTTDGVGSEAEESEDSHSITSSSTVGEDGQSTAFTSEHEDSDSNCENTSTGTSNGPSVTESEGTPGIDTKRVDPSILIYPLAFHKSHNVFAWMGGTHVSADETETDHESAKDYTKASF